MSQRERETQLPKRSEPSPAIQLALQERKYAILEDVPSRLALLGLRWAICAS